MYELFSSKRSLYFDFQSIGTGNGPLGSIDPSSMSQGYLGWGSAGYGIFSLEIINEIRSLVHLKYFFAIIEVAYVSKALIML